MSALLPPPYDLLPLAARTWREIEQEQRLFINGTVASHIYYVAVGEIALVRFTETGREISVCRSRAGDMLAEASLFSTHYHCDGIAIKKAEVCALSKESILKFLQNNAVFAYQLSAQFAMQVQHLRRRQEIIAIKRAEDRVIAAMEDGLLTGDVKSFASEIGLTPEAVYRALARLVRNGQILKTSRGKYVLFK